jgi:hypothetical protein
MDHNRVDEVLATRAPPTHPGPAPC